MSARILEITLQEILFQHPDSLQGMTWRIPKSEVFMVQFQDGTKEVFEQNLPASPATKAAALTPEELRLLGREDALKYYTGSGAMWGSAASAFTMFPIGLVGSVVIGATPPKIENHRISDVNLLQYPDYVQGYKEQAHRRKKGKVLAGVGIGVGIQLTAMMLLMAVMY